MAKLLALKVRRLEATLRPRAAAAAPRCDHGLMTWLAIDKHRWGRFCELAETKNYALAVSLAEERATAVAAACRQAPAAG